MTPQTVLAQTLTLPNGVVIKNRLLKSAMSEALGSRQGAPTPELAHLYQAWAEGGIGLCVTGNVMIDHGALGEPGNVVIADAICPRSKNGPRPPLPTQPNAGCNSIIPASRRPRG